MKNTINDTEIKILSMCLNDDDRVQQRYHNLFKCHYLPDIVQHLRRKLEFIFEVENGNEILSTEYHKVLKVDGTKTRIGIYRIVNKYKKEIRILLKEKGAIHEN